MVKLIVLLFSAQMAKEKPPLTVVGDVGGRIAIMVVSRIILSTAVFSELIALCHHYIKSSGAEPVPLFF